MIEFIIWFRFYPSAEWDWFVWRKSVWQLADWQKDDGQNGSVCTTDRLVEVIFQKEYALVFFQFNNKSILIYLQMS